jgi:hypothetical protein
MTTSTRWTLFWSSVDKVSTSAVGLVVGVVIARLLDPGAYGLIGLISIFIAIAQVLIDSGLSNSLIQKKERTEIDFSTVFYANIVIALFLYGVIFLLAPYVARFYAEPMLVSIMRISGFNLVIMSLFIIQKTRLTIDLRFKKIGLISLLSVAISGGVGIFSAWRGYGVYALLLQTLSMNGVQLFAYWILSKWRPLLLFSWESFASLFSFGSKLMLGWVMNSIYRNLYSLLIGKVYGPTDVGLISKATTWGAMPSQQIGTVINQVAYPVLCKQEGTALKETFFRYLRLSCFIIFPLSGLLIVLAEPLILVLLKDQWKPMIPIFQILVLSRVLDPIKWYNWQIMNVYGESGKSLKAETIAKLLSITILFFSFKLGVLWLCWTLVLYSIYDVAITYLFSVQISKITITEQLKELAPIILAFIILMIASYLGSMLSGTHIVRLTAGGILGLSGYFLAAQLAGIKEFEYLIKHLLTRRDNGKKVY